jgi:hypothetical protein
MEAVRRLLEWPDCHCEEARRSNLMTGSNNYGEIASLQSQ